MNMEEKTRAYIYRVAVALIPLLILYGVLSEAEAALWVGVLAAVLSLGESVLAAVNTSTDSKPNASKAEDTGYDLRSQDETRNPRARPVDPEEL